jgi:hypothetical protein
VVDHLDLFDLNWSAFVVLLSMMVDDVLVTNHFLDGDLDDGCLDRSIGLGLGSGLVVHDVLLAVRLVVPM